MIDSELIQKHHIWTHSIKVPLTMVLGKNLNPLRFDSINWAPYVGFLGEQMLHRSVFIAGGQVCCSYLGASYPLHTFENSVQLFLILQKVCQTMCRNSDVEDVETRCCANSKKNLQTVDIILGQSS